MGSVDASVPELGLGTWQNTEFEQCKKSVRTALEVGYQHIDTAEAYENEIAVGAGIDDANVSRDEVYLATKVLNPSYIEGDINRGRIRTDVKGCLHRLGVNSVDLLYVHWPSDYDLELVHTTLAELRDDGLIEDVGLSNYQPEHVEEALSTDPEVLALQVEIHPLLPQPEIRKFCADVGVEVVAYAPLAQGLVFDIPEIQQVSNGYGVSIAQVTLAWLRAKGVAAVPKATSAEHIQDNWGSRTLDLTEEDVEAIDSIEHNKRLYDRDYAPDW